MFYNLLFDFSHRAQSLGIVRPLTNVGHPINTQLSTSTSCLFLPSRPAIFSKLFRLLHQCLHARTHACLSERQKSAKYLTHPWNTGRVGQHLSVTSHNSCDPNNTFATTTTGQRHRYHPFKFPPSLMMMDPVSTPTSQPPLCLLLIPIPSDN